MQRQLKTTLAVGACVITSLLYMAGAPAQAAPPPVCTAVGSDPAITLVVNGLPYGVYNYADLLVVWQRLGCPGMPRTTGATVGTN
jgi:hypothetical protein